MSRIGGLPNSCRYSLCPHPAYQALGADTRLRSHAYRTLLYETPDPKDLQAIRTYLQQQRALGTCAFQAMVEAKTRRFAGTRPAHRPPQPVIPCDK